MSHKTPHSSILKMLCNSANTQSCIYTFGALALLFYMLLASTASAPAGNWTIDGDRVYINDSKAYISASPHTIHESQWVYFNVSAKNYSGNVDIVFGFDTDKVKPKTAELYKPQTVQLPDTFSEKIFYYVTNITTTSLYPEYGNEYNTYRRQIQHKLPVGHDNSTNSTIWGNFTSIVAFDSYSQSGQNYTINWSTRNYQNTTWTSVADRFDSISWDYDGFNKWYYSTNLPIVAGNYYNLRVWMEVPVSLTHTSGKYGFAIKPSSQTLEQAKTIGNLYYLDPWFNSSWGKRAPIFINNTGNATILTNYQVSLNVTYDSDMNANFSDLRIVNDTGLEIPLWNEKIVNGNYATMWFNATNIPASVWTNDTYYLYYNNSFATTASNGNNTFISYLDFENTSEGFSSGTSNTTQKKFGSYSLSLAPANNKGVTYPSMPYRVMFWIYPTLATQQFRFNGYWGNTKAYNIGSNFAASGQWANYQTSWSNFPAATVVTANSWTKMEFIIKDTANYDVYINDIYQNTVTYYSSVNGNNLLFNRDDGNAIFVDGIIFAKYASKNPVAQLGAEENNIFIPPTPIINTVTQGNFWINDAYTAGAGNITDSYNVSINGTWNNGTTALFTNTTLPAHGWKNVTIYAYNNSGTGTLGAAALTNNTQLLNNPISTTNFNTTYSLYEGQTFSLSLGWYDLDPSDIPTYSDNATQ